MSWFDAAGATRSRDARETTSEASAPALLSAWRMRLPLVFTALAACAGTPDTGTLVFSEANTGNIHAFDVASGHDRLIDGAGAYGSLSISPDQQHFAYVGSDSVVRVADSAGSVTALSPPNGATDQTACSPGPAWGPNNSLAYCIYDQGSMSYGFMPALGVPVRELLATELVIADDASKIVYHRRGPDPTQPGDVVVENADGSSQRVLAASTIETQFELTPDGQQVVAVAEHPDAFRVVVHSLADGTTTDLGPGDLPGAITGSSTFSPDHSEVLGGPGQRAGRRANHDRCEAALRDDRHRCEDLSGGVHRCGSRRLLARPRHDLGQRHHEHVLVPDRERFRRGERGAGYRSQLSRESDLDRSAGGCDRVRYRDPRGVRWHGSRVDRSSVRARAQRGRRRRIVTLEDDGSVVFVAPNTAPRPLAKATSPSDITGTRLGPFAAYAP